MFTREAPGCVHGAFRKPSPWQVGCGSYSTKSRPTAHSTTPSPLAGYFSSANAAHCCVPAELGDDAVVCTLPEPDTHTPNASLGQPYLNCLDQEGQTILLGGVGQPRATCLLQSTETLGAGSMPTFPCRCSQEITHSRAYGEPLPCSDSGVGTGALLLALPNV